MTGAFDFSGKRVLITGASRGIGYAVARGFSASGAKVSILADADEVHSAALRMGEETGHPVASYLCDITDRERVRAVIAEIGPLDILINNAGLERITPIDDPGPEVERMFERIVTINIVGTYYVTREVISSMPSGSNIILTASIWAKTAVGGFSAYCASKHANLGFVRSLAQELGPRGIRVNAVCPGFIRTDASMRTVAVEAARTNRSEDEVTADLLRNQALPNLLTPDEVVPSYLFLASDHAQDISGQSLHIDRGDVMA